MLSLGSSLLLAFVPALVVALALQMKTRLKKVSRVTWKECNWTLSIVKFKGRLRPLNWSGHDKSTSDLVQVYNLDAEYNIAIRNIWHAQGIEIYWNAALATWNLFSLFCLSLWPVSSGREKFHKHFAITCK